MTEKVTILLVEDTVLDIQSYRDAIKSVNLSLKGKYKIELVVEVNLTNGLVALEKLKDNLIGAIIDLKLKTGGPVDDNEGNLIVREIYKKLRFPVFIVTNTPASFDGSMVKSAFLQVFEKTDIQFEDIFKEILKIYQTGITKILSKKGLIEKSLDGIFWDNISTNLNEWYEIKECEKPLLRYIILHLLEHLEFSEGKWEFDLVYPIENYIKPSIKSYFFTGDIIVKEEVPAIRYIILNPACDMAPHGESRKPKATHAILCEIENFSDTPLKSLIKEAKKVGKKTSEKQKIREAKDSILKIIRNNLSPKYYYLPDTSFINGGLINFQRLTSIKIADLKQYKKEATITSPFVKDIIAKFSFYYSRQGSPDFDFMDLLKKHLA